MKTDLETHHESLLMANEDNNSNNNNTRPVISVLKYSLACFFIVIIVSTWVAMSELLQGLEDSYNKPNFLAYIVHASYVLVFPLWIALEKWRCRSESQTESLMYKIKSFWKWGSILGVDYTVFCVVWYLSLQSTLASANNAIFQSSCAFVYILSIPLLGERFSIKNGVAVLVSIGGVILVTCFSDKSDGKSSALGYIYCLLATVNYGLYEVLIKKYGSQAQSPKEQLCDMTLFIGIFGGAVLVFLSIPMVIVHYTGFEVFQTPNYDQSMMILLNIVLDLTCNLAIVFGITLTGPLFIAVGSLLVIPATIVVDVVIKNSLVSPWMIIGCCLIVLGFGILHANELTCFSSSKEKKAKRLTEKK